MLPLFRLESYWEVSSGNTPYMDFAKGTKRKKRVVFGARQPRAAPAPLRGCPGGAPQGGSGAGPAERAAEKGAGEELGQFSALLQQINPSSDVPAS